MVCGRMRPQRGGCRMIDDYTTAADTLQGLTHEFPPPIDQFAAEFQLFAIIPCGDHLIARNRKRRAPPCRPGRQRRACAGQQHAARGRHRDRRPLCLISHAKTPPSVTGVPSMPGRRRQYTVLARPFPSDALWRAHGLTAVRCHTVSVKKVSAKRRDSILAAVLARFSSENRPNTVGPEPLISVPSAPFSVRKSLISPT